MRIKTPEVDIRGIKIGGQNPIRIQSMTDTDTADAKSTVRQIIELADAGSELVRFTVNTNFAAQKVPEIRKMLDAKGYPHLPLIGDFHFNGHTLLDEFPEMAKTLDKYRINPGNIGRGASHDPNFKKFIQIAIMHDKPLRIGVNWGSLDQDLLTLMMGKNAKKVRPLSDKEVLIEAMVKSALDSAQLAEKLGLPQNKIILSVKMSNVKDVVEAYQKLADHMSGHPFALHLGLTEAGSGISGLISSSAALAVLLNQGIGDTIRISLTPEPKSSRIQEVQACKALLQSLELRHFQPKVTSCPGCGRTDSKFFQKLVAEVNKKLETKLKNWIKKYPKVTELKIAVMGCVVNGPGESKYSDIAISLPGKTEKSIAPVYIRGKFLRSLQGKDITDQFVRIVEDFIAKNYIGNN
ncbi:flavodoxin-dependent (E)-4-hydroxy-3-methylbut-2-enyl-diphosphate synthase [Candidatus Peregrinibacteria bacterium]|nr:flavodoxin-dependent (E)-4-hydroxy-3-methylbut-2-enyl-diphosphate synthase [Candidatus Peregrinibacteria bacterium]